MIFYGFARSCLRASGLSEIPGGVVRKHSFPQFLTLQQLRKLTDNGVSGTVHFIPRVKLNNPRQIKARIISAHASDVKLFFKNKKCIQYYCRNNY